MRASATPAPPCESAPRAGRAGRGPRGRRPAALAIATGTLAALLPLAGGAGPAAADTAPPTVSAATPVSVSADPLPTVQINGVVWKQVTLGNTVYATGEFDKARPAGAPAGQQEVARGNLLAYDIRTGALITSFDHSLNGEGRTLTVSPDGRRLYVGGVFTAVDGQSRSRIAAFDTATGALVPDFHPAVNGRVSAIAASDKTVWAGGAFTAVGSTARSHLASFAVAGGALQPWSPGETDGNVSALLRSPDGKRVFVGGFMQKIGAATVNGSASLDALTGELQPWAVNQLVKDYGTNAAITSLSTDGQLVYGTGYNYIGGAREGSGNLEGTFAADPATGALVWVEDCHGDTYDAAPAGGLLYVAGHPYACANIGGFPEGDPRVNRFGLAFSRTATGTVATNTGGNGASGNFGGQPAPTLQTWFPTFTKGSYTGQSQATWSVTGNDSYVAYGGEFPAVNGVPQQGLVRFALPASAPNKVGPRAGADKLVPRVVSLAAGTARVSFLNATDRDNLLLSYTVIRDSQTASPVRSFVAGVPDWAPRTLGFTDTGLVPGSTHTYRIRVADPFGNALSAASTTVTVSARPRSDYQARIAADGATAVWDLDEAAGPTASDASGGFADLATASGVTFGVPGALASQGAAPTAAHFDGTPAGTSGTTEPVAAPTTFSVEAWFRTTSTRGGKLIGFGSSPTERSTAYFDRSVYLEDSGRVRFGIYDGHVRSVVSPASYADGAWHHVVATFGSGGLALFLDGAKVAADTSHHAIDKYQGYWRVGGDTLSGWPAKPSSSFLAADVDQVAVYPTQLSPSSVAAHHQLAAQG